MTQAIGYYGTDSLGYDAAGNLLSHSRASGGTTTSFTYSYNKGTNRLSKAAQAGGSTLSCSYDAAGNLVSRALGKTTQLALSYNADGRPATAGPESYKYDGFGERALINGTTTGHDIFAPSGELLAENTSSGALLRSYVYLNGLPLTFAACAEAGQRPVPGSRWRRPSGESLPTAGRMVSWSAAMKACHLTWTSAAALASASGS